MVKPDELNKELVESQQDQQEQERPEQRFDEAAHEFSE